MARINGLWFMSNNLTGTDSSDDIFGAGFADVLRGAGGNDTIHGGAGDDHIFGDGGNDKLFGDDGNDRLFGGDQDDTLDGGKGDDVLFGGADQDTFTDVHGNNTVDGGSGFDTSDYSGFQGGHVRVTLADPGLQGLAIREDLIRPAGGGSYYLEDGRDTLVSIERVIGTSGDDVITGNSQANVLFGGAGNDVLSGGEGADKLISGVGNDVLSGGGGGDTFVFRDSNSSASAHITDFDSLDRIDLSEMDARPDIAGDQAFHIVDYDHYTGAAGELLINRQSDGSFNVFADGRADFISSCPPGRGRCLHGHGLYPLKF